MGSVLHQQLGITRLSRLGRVPRSARASEHPPRERPRTRITFEQAQAYAQWAGKRLPTDEEWTAVVSALGATRLGTGEVWEWTRTPRRGGHVVRGGRWRDDWQRPASPDNHSHETHRADDVGFRCVLDR